MTVTLKRHHAQVKRMIRVDVASGQNRALQSLVEEAKAGAPVRTGFLRDSIEQHMEASASNPRAAAKVGAEYGAIVNQGGANRAGTFFWTRAVLAMYRNGAKFFSKRR